MARIPANPGQHLGQIRADTAPDRQDETVVPWSLEVALAQAQATVDVAEAVKSLVTEVRGLRADLEADRRARFLDGSE